jgi:hypothetical protein
MGDVYQWAREYRDRGFAVCRIGPGEKRPTYKGWNRRSLEPDEFDHGDNIGLQAGAISGNLVCVDLDHADVLQQADRYLPQTGMVEGRQGKPRSHHWFVVKDIPPELTAPARVAGGLGGPRTRRFKTPEGITLIDFLGTGSQAVVPASVWLSRDGAKRESREWDRLRDPAVVDCAELFEATCRLAAVAGWVRKERSARVGRTLSREAPGPLPMPSGEAAHQARAYLARVAPAVEGEGGDHQTFKAACLLVLDFSLSPEDALPLLLEYNERCVPPWTVEDLRHKLAMADALERDDRGWRVRKRSRAIIVQLLPGEPVYVGVDCAAEGRSYIDLSPSLYTGMVKGGTAWELASELAAVSWRGTSVILAPTSTVTTNAREVWGEFFLARLLREQGAEVQSVRLPPLEGRRRTLAMAGDEGWELVNPPRYPWEAAAAAERASGEARRLDAYRRVLPRRKASPRLAKAVAFIQEHEVRRLTKDVLKKAKRKGITKPTLRRALQSLDTTKPPHTTQSCEVYPSNCTRQDGPIPLPAEDFSPSGVQEAV